MIAAMPRGRQPKPEAERLSVTIAFRVTPPELDQIQRAEPKLPTTMREWIRALVLAEAKKINRRKH